MPGANKVPAVGARLGHCGDTRQGQTGGEQAAKTAVLLILPRGWVAPSDH